MKILQFSYLAGSASDKVLSGEIRLDEREVQHLCREFFGLIAALIGAGHAGHTPYRSRDTRNQVAEMARE